MATPVKHQHVLEKIYAPRAAPPPPPPKPVRNNSSFIVRLVLRIRLLFTPWYEKVLTALYYGPRSQGKSLHQARTVRSILEYLDDLYAFHPELPQSIVVSNQKFSKKFEDKYITLPRPQGPRLYYWENIRQLRTCPRPNCWKGKDAHVLHDAYIVIDDAATIIPADGWQDLPRWFRKIFAQAGHNGVHCIANCQDPNSVDINFRRYVDVCFKFKKVIGNRRPEAGKPPVRRIWGIYTSRQIDAAELWRTGDLTELEIETQKAQIAAAQGEAKTQLKAALTAALRQWKLRIHFIRRRDTEIYDTLQNVPEYMPNTYEHTEIKCADPNCDHITVRHRII